MTDFPQSATFCLLGVAIILNSLTLRIVNRRIDLLQGNHAPRAGKAFITIIDGTSGAQTFWNPKRGCCDVVPVYFPKADAQKEKARAQAFYSPPCKVEVW